MASKLYVFLREDEKLQVSALLGIRSSGDILLGKLDIPTGKKKHIGFSRSASMNPLLLPAGSLVDAHLHFHHRGRPCTAVPIDTEALQEAPNQQHIGKSLGGESKSHTEQKHHLQEKLGCHGAQTPQKSIILLVKSTSAVLQHAALCNCFAERHRQMCH